MWAPTKAPPLPASLPTLPTWKKINVGNVGNLGIWHNWHNCASLPTLIYVTTHHPFGRGPGTQTVPFLVKLCNVGNVGNVGDSLPREVHLSGPDKGFMVAGWHSGGPGFYYHPDLGELYSCQIRHFNKKKLHCLFNNNNNDISFLRPLKHSKC